MSADWGTNLALMFWLAHVLALIGWIALLLDPVIGPVSVRIARLAGLILALVYLGLFLWSPQGLAQLLGDYSLAGIGAVFANPMLALIGWVHYLAFDLWVGSWEVNEAKRRKLPHWMVVPCLVLTFLLGPIGLVAFDLLCRMRGRARTA